MGLVLRIAGWLGLLTGLATDGVKNCVGKGSFIRFLYVGRVITVYFVYQPTY